MYFSRVNIVDIRSNFYCLYISYHRIITYCIVFYLRKTEWYPDLEIVNSAWRGPEIRFGPLPWDDFATKFLSFYNLHVKLKSFTFEGGGYDV